MCIARIINAESSVGSVWSTRRITRIAGRTFHAAARRISQVWWSAYGVKLGIARAGLAWAACGATFFSGCPSLMCVYVCLMSMSLPQRGCSRGGLQNPGRLESRLWHGNYTSRALRDVDWVETAPRRRGRLYARRRPSFDPYSGFRMR